MILNKKDQLLCFVLCALCFVLCACKQKADARTKEVKIINAAVIPQYTQGISLGIYKVMKLNNLSTDQINDLDFSYPDEETYGDHPQFEIFNPVGGNVPAFSLVRSHYFDYAKDPQLIYTLGNRVNGLGSEKTELTVIMPRVHENVCNLIHEQKETTSDLKIPETSIPNLIAFPHEVESNNIFVLPNKDGCLKVHGDYYYYRVLLER